MLAASFKKCNIKMVKGFHVEAQVVVKPTSETFNGSGIHAGTFDNKIAQSFLRSGYKIGHTFLGFLLNADMEIVCWA